MQVKFFVLFQEDSLPVLIEASTPEMLDQVRREIKSGANIHRVSSREAMDVSAYVNSRRLRPVATSNNWGVAA